MSLHLAIDLMIICLFFRFCSSTDTISTTQFIRDPETVISNGGVFKFGFFSPTNTTKRYVGVMYTLSITTIVWVANKDVPLDDNKGKVAIAEDGNLVVLNGQEAIVWSTNISNSKVNSTAQILDSGNLVLRDNSSGAILWESFDHPCDSLLPNMRLSKRSRLISWKTSSDPSTGRFSVGFGPSNIPDIFLWDMGQPVWRSGPWNGQIFTGIPDMTSAYNNGFHIVNDEEGDAYLTYNYANVAPISYFALDSNGSLMHKYWSRAKQDWGSLWMDFENECSVYGKCGPFGICNFQDTQICNCLRGYEPKYMDEWSRSNWTSGCVRRAEFQCERNSTVRQKGKADGFLKLTGTKVPDFGQWSGLTDGCGSDCLNNCSCVAYSYDTGIGCMHWTGSLIDLQKFSSGTGAVDIYLRLPYSELDKKRGEKRIVVPITVVLVITVALTTYLCWTCMAKRKGKEKETELVLSGSNSIYQVKFEFENLMSATGNFNPINKLGEGGFGPVYKIARYNLEVGCLDNIELKMSEVAEGSYWLSNDFDSQSIRASWNLQHLELNVIKGQMGDGQEIAVKRLSKSSGQGMEEFVNEVRVISELQHRNLVKLLGCCIEGEEKMLVYEYMPNTSLDALIFDPLRREHLPWCIRKNIIEGIGRGLLYLHRDSRLKIIHRDLKASNILLDKELNPKISDFGMARIFGGTQDHEKTRRVVGTYGYMSPEYAMKGNYSEKSDVYSFGVILLEIISGRRSTSVYSDDKHTLSLPGLAWKLWSDHKSEALIDVWIEACFRTEILRYINVGLLCVQELAKDRPTVSNILSMLSSDNEDLPKPKQPAFTERETTSEMMESSNRVTNTILEGR